MRVCGTIPYYSRRGKDASGDNQATSALGGKGCRRVISQAVSKVRSKPVEKMMKKDSSWTSVWGDFFVILSTLKSLPRRDRMEREFSIFN